jgi:hypothetical protein
MMQMTMLVQTNNYIGASDDTNDYVNANNDVNDM